MSGDAERAVLLLCYVLHLVGAVSALPSLVALVLNYLSRNSPEELSGSHHRWMIRSFWWAVLWLLVGYATLVIVVGWPILGLAWAWYIYRHIRGLVHLVNNDPTPA